MPLNSDAGAGLFAATSGACTVVDSGTCFRSPNYPSNYGRYENCRITVTAHEPVTLSVVFFSTYTSTHRLTVAGVQYSRTSGPDGVQVAAGATITFTSDSSYTSSGFEVCGASSHH